MMSTLVYGVRLQLFNISIISLELPVPCKSQYVADQRISSRQVDKINNQSTQSADGAFA